MAFQGEQTKGLLYKMATEAWVSHYRKLNTEKKYRLRFRFKEDSNPTEDHLFYQELKGIYELALAQLPEKRRTVFLMNRMEQLTYPEIADRLGISAKAVEKRMNLALKDLRAKINPA